MTCKFSVEKTPQPKDDGFALSTLRSYCFLQYKEENNIAKPAKPPTLELRQAKASVPRGTPTGGMATIAAAITRAKQTAAILRAVFPNFELKNEMHCCEGGLEGARHKGLAIIKKPLLLNYYK
jgi:hypothetical protein